MTTLNTALTIKQNQSIDKSLTTIGKKAPSRNTSIQSVSSNVFNDSIEMVHEDFETPKKTAKRHLSAKSDGQEANSPYSPPKINQILPPVRHKSPLILLTVKMHQVKQI
ncbi:hypothetical protein QTP88_027289 [Uroleucon formosanum]